MPNTDLVTITVPLADFMATNGFTDPATRLVNLRYDRINAQVQLITETIPEPEPPA